MLKRIKHTLNSQHNAWYKLALTATSAVFICLLAFLFVIVDHDASSAARVKGNSSELAFYDVTPHGEKGGRIVPASCPSDPHTAGECYAEAAYYGQGGYYAQPYYQSYYQPVYYSQPYYQGGYYAQPYYQSYYQGYYQSYYQAYYQPGYYSQPYYQPGYYSQSYYQSYYQAAYYSQGYYQGYYQSYYQGYYQSYYQAYYQPYYQPAYPVNGTCSASHYSCSLGTSSGGTDMGTYWKWTCNGLFGGSNASCTETKPTGAITSYPGCSVNAGNSTCATTVSWTTSNGHVVNLIGGGSTLVGLNGTNQGRTLSYGGNTYTLKDNTYGINLDTQTVTTSCVAATHFDGSKCWPDQPTVTVTPTTNTINGGGATSFSWSSSGPVTACNRYKNGAFDQGGVGTSGSFTSPALNSNTTYEIRCGNVVNGVEVDGSGTQTVTVRATPSLAFNGDYGDVAVADTVSHFLTATNIGDGLLTGTVIITSDTSGGMFTVVSGGGGPNKLRGSGVSSGATDNIRVDFSPTATGTVTATLRVHTNNGDQDFPLIGNGSMALVGDPLYDMHDAPGGTAKYANYVVKSNRSSNVNVCIKITSGSEFVCQSGSTDKTQCSAMTTGSTGARSAIFRVGFKPAAFPSGSPATSTRDYSESFIVGYPSGPNCNTAVYPGTILGRAVMPKIIFHEN